jgi:tripartite-type tricarboxylate transporter receptor subunit TctC
VTEIIKAQTTRHWRAAADRSHHPALGRAREITAIPPTVRGGTPSEFVARHADAINQALAMADVKQSLAGLGLEATGSSPQRFSETMASERKRWEPLARDAGIELN